MYNLLKAETYKLKHSKELLTCIIGLFVLGAITIYYGGESTGKESLSSQSREMFGLMACTCLLLHILGKILYLKL